MSAELAGNRLFTALDADGKPITGAHAYFYLAGSSTPANVYHEAALSTPWNQSTSGGSQLESDSSGRFPSVYFSTSVALKCVIKDAGGATIPNGTIDPFNTVDASLTVVANLNDASDGNGADMILYKRRTDATGTFAMTVRDRLGYDVNVMEWISSRALRDAVVARSVGSGSYTALTAYLQAAFDNAPLGCRLIFPPGTYPVNDTLTMSRQMDLIAPGGLSTRLTGNFSGVAKNLLNVEVSVASALAGDVRLMQFEGLTLYCNSGGADMIFVQNQTPMASNLQMGMRHMAIGGGSETGKGLHFKGVVTQVHVIERCLLDDGIHLEGIADSCTFRDNLVGGASPNVAFTVAMAEGAWKTLFDHNTIVNKNGAFDIQAGGQIDIIRCQMEQSGVNAGPHQATVNIVPTAVGIRQVNIEGCNFGGGGNVEVSIYADGGAGFFTDQLNIGPNNTFNTTNSLVDVVLNSTGVRWANIHPEQRLRGNRGTTVITGSTASANTDDNRLAVTDSGVGTMGVVKLAATLTIGNAWASTGFSYTKAPDGTVSFTGKLTAGTVTAATIITTLPAGFRPAADTILSCATGAADGVIAKLKVSTAGVITVIFCAAAADVYLPPFTAIRHTKYDPGA